ncbi:hypothetical protein NDU88_005527 [Pleurodeles waltl]|uniref:Uncharacterized protein n=1 Tax=Pleurodeles waltl TaxID=8319 RepID=A0AAV7QJ37_PLEWA|nr:hypothetical protein NDU88_005527 [Pleurodeles waltl]
MQFLDSSVQKKREKPDKPRSARFSAPLRDGHLGAATPSTPPGGRIAGEGERRKRAEFGPDPPSDRFWPSGRLVGRTATAASAAAAVYAAGKYGPPRANPARLLCYGCRGCRAFGSPSAPLMGGTARAQLRRR